MSAQRSSRAVNEYKSAMDSLQRWIEEQCDRFEPGNKDLLEPFSDIFSTYNHWAALNGEPLFKNRGFAKRLDDKGLINITGTGNIRFRQGVKINDKLRVKDNSLIPQKKLDASCVNTLQENPSQPLTVNSDKKSSLTKQKDNEESLQTIIDSRPDDIDFRMDDSQAERRKTLFEVIRHQIKINPPYAVLPAIMDAMKDKGYSESKIETDIRVLKELGELMEVPNKPGFYELT